MLFLADENIPGKVVRGLRERGHDVVAVAETLQGIDDRGVLAAVATTRRILITEDQGFGDLVVRQGWPVAGLVVLQLRRLSTDRYAFRAVEAVTASLDRLDGAVLIVEPGRLRSRPLPATR